MHGLPIEGATMKQLGLHNNLDIEAFGVDKFVDACRELAVRYRKGMDEDFERLGISQDFKNAYQPITSSYTDGVWMLIKRAHERSRLYEGLRTMAWDPVFETACAKHELEYRTVTDQSIYVKFLVKSLSNSTPRFLIIWTTTPWTIPFNMAIMVNPEINYVIARVGREEWVVAASLADDAITAAAGHEYTIISTIKGEELAGTEYKHPFEDINDYSALASKHERMHSVVLSQEYVDDSAGTGLVHCAPGCGPEDYEVGLQYGLPTYNTVRSDGRFPAPFEGLRARIDDKKFTELLIARGAIAGKRAYEHEYPHSERSKAAVIYRATKQWFFRVSDLRDRLLAANDAVEWQPVAAYNAFRSWLENLRDNSITKQRYWGTPVPIWRCDETGETIVIGSLAELAEKSGVTLADAHRPWIDAVTIPSTAKPGAVLRRIPDVLDVWVDAGTASWNTLNYPHDQTTIASHYPADFILEGKDQIRGWFNMLMIAGFLAFDGPAFKAVYMHGFINDSAGLKMSKSMGNGVTPQELSVTHGTDALRFYLVGAAAPATDMSFTIEDLETKAKSLIVLWNTVQYLKDLCRTGEIVPRDIDSGDEEERYLLSRLERMTKNVTDAADCYNLPLIPKLIEDFWLELSRTYIQLTREKSGGEERQLVADLLYTSLERVLILLAPIAPFITEALWQQLGELVGRDDSVHEQSWPQARTDIIDESLEQDFGRLQQIVTAGLAAREKLKQGVRWPLAIARITASSPLARYDRLLGRHLNVRAIEWNPVDLRQSVHVTPNFTELAKSFGRDTQRVASLITEYQPAPPVTIGDFTILEQHIKRTVTATPGYEFATFTGGAVYLSSEVSSELLEEGYGRELTRRVQQLRRDEGFEKRDRIVLCITGHDVPETVLSELHRRTGAQYAEDHFANAKDELIRDRTYRVSCQKVI